MMRPVLFLILAGIAGLAQMRPQIRAALQQQPQTRMIINQSSLVIVTVNNVITNTCDGSVSLHSPEVRDLFIGYNGHRGQSIILGPYDANTELVFQLSPSSWCSGYQYLSTNTLHAHITELEAPNSWRIDWEDMPDDSPPDNDFNDLILVVRAVGEVPDFKQDRPDDQDGWENDPYDNIESTIGRVGCATTSAADLLHYYGAVDVNPRTLDDCLSRDDASGYVRWEDDLDCIEGRINDCDAGAIRWNHVHLCSDPDDPRRQPYLMRFVGKTRIGNPINDPVTGYSQPATQDDLLSLAHEDLANGWPVIFEVEHPNSTSGVHYVVGKRSQDNEILINDPMCGEWPDCPESRATLSDFGSNLSAIVQFRPGDSVFRPTLIVDAHSPVEFYVIDPKGRRTGQLPDGTYVNEIPTSNYYFQLPILDDQTHQPMGDGFMQFYAIGTDPGDYIVIVTGTGEGDYILNVEYTAAPLVVHSSQQKGSTVSGEVQKYNLQVNKNHSPTWIPEESISPTTVGVDPVMPYGPVLSPTSSPTTGILVYTEPSNAISTISQPSPNYGFGIVLLVFILAGGCTAIYSLNHRSHLKKNRILGSQSDKAFLIGEKGAYAQAKMPLLISAFNIGRSPSNNLRLVDQMVSGRHARIRFAKGRWYVQDLASRTGTFINEQQVNAVELNDGDRIRIGLNEFVFRRT